MFGDGIRHGSINMPVDRYMFLCNCSREFTGRFEKFRDKCFYLGPHAMPLGIIHHITADQRPNLGWPGLSISPGDIKHMVRKNIIGISRICCIQLQQATDPTRPSPTASCNRHRPASGDLLRRKVIAVSALLVYIQSHLCSLLTSFLRPLRFAHTQLTLKKNHVWTR